MVNTLLRKLSIILFLLIAFVFVSVNYFPWQRRYMLCDETLYRSKHPQLGLLRNLAEQGDSVAQCSLGFAYLEGYADSAPDATAAYAWFRKSAEQGNATAQRWLGIHFNGMPEGVEWFHKSAEQGDPSAQMFLADIYLKGKNMPQDNAKAVKWYRRAAEQGMLFAQMFLAESYRQGTHGLPKDYIQAYVWWRIAITNSEFDQKRIAEYEQGMTSQQLAQAKSLAKQWEPKYEPIRHLSILGACCMKLD